MYEVLSVDAGGIWGVLTCGGAHAWQAAQAGKHDKGCNGMACNMDREAQVEIDGQGSTGRKVQEGKHIHDSTGRKAQGSEAQGSEAQGREAKGREAHVEDKESLEWHMQQEH